MLPGSIKQWWVISNYAKLIIRTGGEEEKQLNHQPRTSMADRPKLTTRCWNRFCTPRGFHIKPTNIHISGFNHLANLPLRKIQRCAILRPGNALHEISILGTWVPYSLLSARVWHAFKIGVPSSMMIKWHCASLPIFVANPESRNIFSAWPDLLTSRHHFSHHRRHRPSHSILWEQRGSHLARPTSPLAIQSPSWRCPNAKRQAGGKCTSSDVLPTVDFQTMDQNQSKLIVRPNQEIMAKRGCPGDKMR